MSLVSNVILVLIFLGPFVNLRVSLTQIRLAKKSVRLRGVDTYAVKLKRKKKRALAAAAVPAPLPTPAPLTGVEPPAVIETPPVPELEPVPPEKPKVVEQEQQ